MSFPLAPPSGMRDLLPPEAAVRAQTVSALTKLFERWGYARVTTPPFELAEVLERGLDTLDPRDILRFVEPETGGIALMRPDITPQIARIVATRLADRPPPFRLCYAGSLIRRRRGRARRRRQILQAGVELVGLDGVDGDSESIGLACRALHAVGLEDFRVELSLVGLARSALAAVGEDGRDDVEAALIRKDGAELVGALKRAGASKDVTRRLLGVADLHGEVAVLADARRLFRSAADRAALRSLGRLIRRLESQDLGHHLAVDLGEVRGASYYTGVSFRLLAQGPGEPVGAGGRYDGLLGRFGAPMPATGFGIDVGNLEWALTACGKAPQLVREPRVVVAGGRVEQREAIAARLRAAEISAAVVPLRSRASALDYALRWGYDAAVVVRGSSAEATRRDGARRALPRGSFSAFARWARGHGSDA